MGIPLFWLQIDDFNTRYQVCFRDDTQTNPYMLIFYEGLLDAHEKHSAFFLFHQADKIELIC